MKITINGTEFTLKFGYGCLRELSRIWQVETLQGVIERFAQLDGMDASNISFSQIDMFIDVLKASVFAAEPVGDNWRNFNDGDAGQFLMQNPDKIAEIIRLFVESMPVAKPAEAGKPEPAKKKPAPNLKK